MILAGDIGGTNTRLGLFDRSSDRPRQVSGAVFPSLEYSDLEAIVSEFAPDRNNGADIEAAAFGVAGPVLGERARLTNLPWQVDSSRIAEAFGIPKVGLLNDLQAMAYAVPVLRPSEVFVLQEGAGVSTGNIALLAAGTGLGETVLHNLGDRYVPMASEGGHADFAARNEREIDLLRDLLQRDGHAEVEQVVSGVGLLTIHRITHTEPCAAVEDLADPHAPAAITAAALARRCRGCVEALNMFVEAYGAEAGNLALRSVARGGVFLGGGIAPKILPALSDGRFTRAFTDKAPPFHELLAAIPVKVILNEDAGLIGAAIYAAALADSSRT